MMRKKAASEKISVSLLLETSRHVPLLQEIALHIVIHYMTVLHLFNTKPADRRLSHLPASAIPPFNCFIGLIASNSLLMVTAPLPNLII